MLNAIHKTEIPGSDIQCYAARQSGILWEAIGGGEEAVWYFHGPGQSRTRRVWLPMDTGLVPVTVEDCADGTAGAVLWRGAAAIRRCSCPP